MACDTDQYEAFVDEGMEMTPGNCCETWVETLRTTIGSPVVEWQLVNGLGGLADACSPAAICAGKIAVINHIRWPDGVADDSGQDHEPLMLGFLRDHPLE